MAIEITKNGATIGVGKLPGRKSDCLYFREESAPGLMVTVAYFRSESDGHQFLRVLCTAAGIPQADLQVVMDARETLGEAGSTEG